MLDQYKFRDATAQFQQILKIDPDLVPAWVNLGIAFFYDQKYDQSVDSLKKALALEPDEIHAHYVLGLIYRNQDDVKNAIEAFQAVNRQDPDDPSTNYYLGRLHMRDREFGVAVDYFRQVIKTEPYNASAHYNLAQALGRSGKREDSRTEMDEFRRLQELFGSTTVGLQYLEQGSYAIAIDNINPHLLGGYRPEGAPAIRVSFDEVAAQAGLAFTHAGSGLAPRTFSSLSEFEDKVVPALGSGVSFADFDNDGHLDLYLANAGTGKVTGELFRSRGDGTFEDWTGKSGVTYAGKTMQALWGDYDNDGYADLYLVNYGANALYKNQQNGTFKDVTAATGTGDTSWGTGGGFVDFDHDGDLDILVVNFAVQPEKFTGEMKFPDDLKGAANRLYRNNGNGTFTEVGKPSRLGLEALKTLSFVASDLDNSRDIDFYFVNHDAPNQLFNNLRDGSFKSVTAEALTRSGKSLAAAVGDLNRDGSMDLGITSEETPDSALLINQGHDRFQSEPFPYQSKVAPLNTQFFDFDNDGDLDVLVLVAPLFGEEASLSRERNLYLYENRDGKFTDVSSSTGLDKVVGKAIRGLSIADYDSDGDLDFVINVNGGSPLLLRNDGGNRNNWFSVRITGTNSNKYGIGVKAEIKAGSLWLKQETVGGQGFLTQNPPIVHFGLGRHNQADVVRILWPNGVLQSEIDRPANQLVEIQELDRKGTSCPIMYVWNGKSYQFQTDFLGGSAYANLVAPGIYETPDTNEYVKLNRSDVKLRDGQVAITMNNQLEEVILFDQLELVAVDHPANYEIFPDEKLLPGPPYQDFRIFTAEAPRPPVSAVDGKGRDILGAIRNIDRIYPEVANTLPFKGYTETHEVVLDLGDVSADYAVLLMHAWIDYADSSSTLAAWQAGVELIPPYLQVQDAQGRWVTAIERMGFPAGLPKTMTVDLSGKFISASRKVRVVTNMKLYWDQVLVESGAPHQDFRLHRLQASSADLHYKGFPKFASPDGRKPNVYSYDEQSRAEWKVHLGAYTRFGDVKPLLEAQDNRFVITRSGDEIAARFDVSALPPLPDGWVRDYLVYVDGFGKDMDPNSASPEFLGPLPFHGMASYPYTQDSPFLDDPVLREYLRTWNTRVVEQALPDLERPGLADE